MYVICRLRHLLAFLSEPLFHDVCYYTQLNTFLVWKLKKNVHTITLIYIIYYNYNRSWSRVYETPLTRRHRDSFSDHYAFGTRVSVHRTVRLPARDRDRGMVIGTKQRRQRQCKEEREFYTMRDPPSSFYSRANGGTAHGPYEHWARALPYSCHCLGICGPRS